MGCEAATWRLMAQESEHAPPEQAEGGRAARQTPPPAISMVSEGAEGLSEVPVQGHPASPEGRTVGVLRRAKCRTEQGGCQRKDSGACEYKNIPGGNPDQLSATLPRALLSTLTLPNFSFNRCRRRWNALRHLPLRRNAPPTQTAKEAYLLI